MRIASKVTSKTVLSLATAGLLATSLAACSSSGTSSTSSSSASSPAASPSPVATLSSLSGVSTSVKLDPTFLSALTTLHLTPGVVGKATLAGDTISFPITGGNVTYYSPNSGVTPYVQGTINHDGSGLSLSAGGTKVELTNFVVDPGTSKLMGDVSANGKSVVKGAYLFFLDGRTLQPLKSNSDGTATLAGTEVKISPDAAMLLDSTFKTTAVTPYFLVGTATITVKG
ncbi:MAG TPA: hypothetical protein VGN54_07200 [Mycobacteriales bacterium]|nr:hypothetical protein [Mycobacteriales bacterium]